MKAILNEQYSIWEDDDNANKNSDTTMHYFDVDEEITGNGDWDVAIQYGTEFEVFMYEDKVAIASQIDDPEEVHLYASEFEVDPEYVDDLKQHLVNDKEALKKHSTDGILRTTAPDRLLAFKNNIGNGGTTKEEDVSRVTFEDEDISESYIGGLPKSAHKVGLAAVFSHGALTSHLVEEDEEAYWNYEIELPYEEDIDPVRPEDF